jgi:uroporphyrin-3 C-methyltransferase
MLARELTALEAVPAIDVPGLFARLGALSARVDDFNVVVDGAVEDFTVPSHEGDAAASGWWSGVKQTLGEYFVVTRSTTDIAPQLGSGEQFLLRTLVQLHIEQARLALLNAEPALYRAALDDARAVAQRWLSGDAASKEALLAALDELRDTVIVSALPASGDALEALQQVAGASTPVAPAPPTNPAATMPIAPAANATGPTPAAPAPSADQQVESPAPTADPPQ